MLRNRRRRQVLTIMRGFVSNVLRVVPFSPIYRYVAMCEAR